MKIKTIKFKHFFHNEECSQKPIITNYFYVRVCFSRSDTSNLNMCLTQLPYVLPKVKSTSFYKKEETFLLLFIGIKNSFLLNVHKAVVRFYCERNVVIEDLLSLGWDLTI